jgi:hypothetical protein
MATQIVMDRTGDTRHIFKNHDPAEVEKGRAAIQGIDRRWLYRSGPVRPGRTTDYPLLRSHGEGNAVLSASGWRLTAVSSKSCMRWALVASPCYFGRFRASWRGLVPGLQRSASKQRRALVEGMALAGAARVLRALSRHGQRYRNAIPDTPRHPDQHRGTEPHGGLHGG